MKVLEMTLLLLCLQPCCSQKKLVNFFPLFFFYLLRLLLFFFALLNKLIHVWKIWLATSVRCILFNCRVVGHVYSRLTWLGNVGPCWMGCTIMIIYSVERKSLVPQTAFWTEVWFQRKLQRYCCFLGNGKIALRKNGRFSRFCSVIFLVIAF